MESKTTIRHDTTDRHLKKYTNRNPIHRLTLSRFFDAVADEIRDVNPGQVLEFGCGEGLFLQELKNRGILFERLTGVDLRDEALRYARSLHPEYEFIQVDLLTWDCPKKGFDLVIASQVLEHLINPGDFLEKLVTLSRKHLIVTVPWEPWFRTMNLLRGRDIRRLGNHPEHINLWGLAQFKQFVSKYIEIEYAYTVFPFIVLKARV